jgi:hypothetical protein
MVARAKNTGGLIKTRGDHGHPILAKAIWRSSRQQGKLQALSRAGSFSKTV